MAGFNQVTILGRMTDFADVRTTTSGKDVAKFTLAVDKYKEGTNFFEVEVWGIQVGFIKKYTGKGHQLLISGYLDHQTWEKDGQKRNKVVIIATTVVSTQKKEQGENTTQSNPAVEISDSEVDFSQIPF